MLSLSNTDLIETLRLFKSVNIPVAFLVPTKTGIEKSIMDATKEVREFFFDNHIHDFEGQLQGEESKVLLDTKLFSMGQIINTKTSLYRPRTKLGDPRMWIYKLVEYADPTDLLAITKHDTELVIINCSKSDLKQILDIQSQTFKEFFLDGQVGESDAANELVSKLKVIAGKGFINTLRPGDTGVGFTLETLLGIEANSSKKPDYKGIEIKTSRNRNKRSNRYTILSQVPNWNISRLKGSKDLLYERGRFHEDKQRIQLFHELSAIKTNSYGLKLEVEEPYDFLHQIYVTKNNTQQKDVTWEIPVLKNRLSEKHQETFWITADTIGDNGYPNEKFRYVSIKHTGKLDTQTFPILLELGIITVDYTIKEKEHGGAKDQGYLFKISPNNLDLMFSSTKYYDLT